MKKKNKDSFNKNYRINHRIRAKKVRTIGPNGEQIGILPINEALLKAQQENLDLVELAPYANPPVCKIMDFGKMRYELSKKQKQQKKNQGLQPKTVKISPNIGENDLTRKISEAQKFIDKGHKVTVQIDLKGRWRQSKYQNVALAQMDRVKENIVNATYENNAISKQGSKIFLTFTKEIEQTT